MTGCPSLAVLSQFLAGEPTSTDVGPHLRDCPACQEAAERLSDPGELRAWARDASTSPSATADGPDADALARLVDQLCRFPPGAGRDLDEPTAPAPAPIALDPSGPDGGLGALGTFVIEAEVGRGGMGVVYRARDRATGRIVALKVLDPGRTDEATIRRFHREGRIAARIEHDHVVRLYTTSDPAERLPYFVMEFVEGRSLAAVLHDRRRLDPRGAAEVIAQAAAGLEAAHRLGVVHRDVKPGNILIEAATGRAKLGDFGLAFLTSETSDLTREGVIAGTPTYLSPEQIRAEPRGGPAPDIYALGVTLYECLSGEPPFRGSTQRVLHQVLHDEPRPPRELNDAVPRDLETVCLKAMDKDPARRYADAGAFRDDLRRWLDGQPVVARPIGRAERLVRLTRRHPAVSALIAALALALIGGTAGVFWQWRIAEANARRSQAYLKRTLDLIDAYFVKVSENQLLNVPNLQSLRKELLGGARDTYTEILRDRPDDPAIHGQLADVRMRLAMVVSAIGSTDEALRLLAESAAELDALVQAHPGDTVTRLRRLQCWIQAGAVELGAGRLPDARRSYQRALDEAQQSLRAQPDDPRLLEVAYSASHGLGRIATLENAGAESVAAFEQALALNDRLLRIQPDSATYLRNTSRTNGLLADLELTRGHPDQSRSAFNRGYEATKQLVRAHPDSLDYRFALAHYHNRRGMRSFTESLTMHGREADARVADARGAAAEANAIDRELARENPRVESYRFDLLSNLLYAALVELGAGAIDSELALLDEARILASKPAQNPAIEEHRRGELARILVASAYARSQAGDPAAAFRDLDEGDALMAAVGSISPQNAAPFAQARALLASARGFLLREAGRPTEALKFLDRASAEDTPYRFLLELVRDHFRFEAGLGPAPEPARLLAVIPLLDSITRSSSLPGVADTLYASFYARAAEATESAVRETLEASAVLRLDKARASGYLRDPRRLRAIEHNPAFRHILTRPDFQALRAAILTPDPEPPPGLPKD